MTELRWKTFNHIFNPHGDLIWHLFWGVIAGICFIVAILNYDYWLLVFSILALIFFFHPKFYEARMIEIKLTQEGFFINQKFYPWQDFSHFEIFDNEFRKFIYLSSQKTKTGIHFPLEEFFISEEEVRDFVSQFLKEAKNSIPLFDRFYRNIFL